MTNIIQKLIFAFFLVIFSYPAIGATTLLVQDSPNKYQLPRNFRVIQKQGENIPLTGIEKLHLMGSGQFSEANLRYILAHYPKPDYIFDLRQESHGFVNGIAVSWFGNYNWANLDKSEKENQQMENQLLAQIKGKKEITIHEVTRKNKGIIEETSPITVNVQSVYNEQQLVEQNHIKYVRIRVSDHRAPSHEAVLNFVNIMRTIPGDARLYFHCKAGRGRTTTFMAMVDIMRNAKEVSFADIVARQHLMGGINLTKKQTKKVAVIVKEAQIRLEFLEKFYAYCRSNRDQFRTLPF
jgi:protein-tyrosine phosphatase